MLSPTIVYDGFGCTDAFRLGLIRCSYVFRRFWHSETHANRNEGACNIIILLTVCAWRDFVKIKKDAVDSWGQNSRITRSTYTHGENEREAKEPKVFYRPISSRVEPSVRCYYRYLGRNKFTSFFLSFRMNFKFVLSTRVSTIRRVDRLHRHKIDALHITYTDYV